MALATSILCTAETPARRFARDDRTGSQTLGVWMSRLVVGEYDAHARPGKELEELTFVFRRTLSIQESCPQFGDDDEWETIESASSSNETVWVRRRADAECSAVCRRTTIR